MHVYIKKEERDPLAVRISAGGNHQDGAYLSYRGRLSDVRDILIEILAATKDFEERPIGVGTLMGRDLKTEKKGVCRKCGCTWIHACVNQGQTCHWVDESQTLCSNCA